MRLEKSDDLENVYKLFGMCAHHCSNIEYSVAFLLHPAKWAKHRSHLEYKAQETKNKLGDIKQWNCAMRELDEGLETVEQEIDKLYTGTLGSLIEQIKSNYSLSEEQSKYLKEILEKRNYIIHKTWGTYGRRLKDPLVVKEMLKEMQSYEAYFRFASDWLQEQARLLNGISLK